MKITPKVFAKKKPAYNFLLKRKKRYNMFMEDISKCNHQQFYICDINTIYSYIERKFLQKNRVPSIYEGFLRDMPVNFGQDIDMTDMTEIKNYRYIIKDIIDKTTTNLYNLSNEKPVIISLTAKKNSNEKLSYHIIYRLPTFIFKDIYHCKHFASNINLEYKCIDLSIYRAGCMRTCFSKKMGREDDKQLIYDDEFSTYKNDNDKDLFFNSLMVYQNKRQKNIIKIEQNKKIQTRENNNKKSKISPNIILNNIKPKILLKNNFETYKKLFDMCYKQERFDEYNNWITVGMALMNIYGMDGFEVFDYFSAKGSNYSGTEKTRAKYTSFIHNYKEGYTTKTIYYFAKEDNIKEYIKIMGANKLSLLDDDFARKIKELAGNRFIYKKDGENGYKLYCYNGKYWVQDEIVLKQYIYSDLYEYYKEIILDVYWESPDFSSYKRKIDRLKTVAAKKNIVESYKLFGINNDIVFDEKWWLLGFNDVVYDLKLHTFRGYKYSDYITMTTNYNWKEPTIKQINKINKIITSIMPIKEEKELYLEILCTTLEGRCLENFNVFNGSGGNGKGLLNDLLVKALGDFAIISNNSILFEKSKTGSNPEKANLDKKRLVIFREPPEKDKFQNSIIKELTGGGKFSARTHHEKATEKILHNTTICECNKKPLFAEEPTNADIRRIIDILFRSVFTTDESLIDNKNFIFEAKAKYKSFEFQDKYKYALIKILIETHKKYTENNFKLTIPDNIKQRTKNYLEDSCDILQWFKENYDKTEKNDDILRIADIYNNFSKSDLYSNMTKAEKRKYNLKNFTIYFQTNIYLKKFYKKKIYSIAGKKVHLTNNIIGWAEISDYPFTDSDSYD